MSIHPPVASSNHLPVASSWPVISSPGTAILSGLAVGHGALRISTCDSWMTIQACSLCGFGSMAAAARGFSSCPTPKLVPSIRTQPPALSSTQLPVASLRPYTSSPGAAVRTAFAPVLGRSRTATRELCTTVHVHCSPAGGSCSANRSVRRLSTASKSGGPCCFNCESSPRVMKPPSACASRGISLPSSRWIASYASRIAWSRACLSGGSDGVEASCRIIFSSFDLAFAFDWINFRISAFIVLTALGSPPSPSDGVVASGLAASGCASLELATSGVLCTCDSTRDA
mmetsp:Transcript_11122/g.32705  ORF Transcript_11122/g.32705 Transcript_11122/m.32705 type:complete len:286 (-) Transcript_11122:843-1700(-)